MWSGRHPMQRNQPKQISFAPKACGCGCARSPGHSARMMGLTSFTITSSSSLGNSPAISPAGQV